MFLNKMIENNLTQKTCQCLGCDGTGNCNKFKSQEIGMEKWQENLYSRNEKYILMEAAEEPYLMRDDIFSKLLWIK